MQTYKELINKHTSNDTNVHTDLLCNYYAATTSAGLNNNDEYDLLHLTEGESYRLEYNVGCAQIASGNIDKAKVALSKALQLYSRVQKEQAGSDSAVVSSEGLTENAPIRISDAVDLDNGTISAEGMSIMLQSVFVDTVLGLDANEHKATFDDMKNVVKSFTRIPQSDIEYSEQRAIAANNLIVLRGDKDIPETVKRFRHVITSETRLSVGQLMDIKYNQCILLLYQKKVDECLRILTENLDKM